MQDPDGQTGMLYFDLIMARLSEGLRTAVEARMQQAGQRYQSEFVRRLAAEVEAKVKPEVEARVKAEVEASVKAEGRAEGEAEAIVAVLEARGLAISAEQRERIRQCGDLGMLGRWIRRAATVSSADEVFVD